MKLMEWFNINEHADIGSWKPFFVSFFLTLSSGALEYIDVASAISSIFIKIGQLVTVILAAYIAANNAHAIYKKKQEGKRERERTGN